MSMLEKQCKVGQDHKKKAEEAHTHYNKDREKDAR